MLSCVQVFETPDPMDCSSSGSSVHQILQARIVEWVAIPFFEDLPNPRIKPTSPALQEDFLLSKPPGKPNVSTKKKVWWKRMELRGWCVDLEMHSKEWKKSCREAENKESQNISGRGSPTLHSPLSESGSSWHIPGGQIFWFSESPDLLDGLLFFVSTTSCSFWVQGEFLQIGSYQELKVNQAQSSGVQLGSPRVRRKWQPTSVFLPGESHGWRSLVGCSP